MRRFIKAFFDTTKILLGIFGMSLIVYVIFKILARYCWWGILILLVIGMLAIFYEIYEETEE